MGYNEPDVGQPVNENSTYIIVYKYRLDRAIRSDPSTGKSPVGSARRPDPKIVVSVHLHTI